jgi:hypothetical protein
MAAPCCRPTKRIRKGFDNVASVLSVSPALLENYLSAARAISRLAVGDPGHHPVVDTFKISKALVQDERLSDELPFGSRGGALVRYYFPLDAEYTIKVLLRRQEYDYIIGMGERHQLDFRLDGVRIKRFSVGGEAKGMTTPENFAGNTQGDPEFEEYMHTADAHLEARVAVKAGLHEVGVSFVGRLWEPEGVLQPPQTGFGRTTNEYYHGNPAVEIVMIGGPYGSLAGSSVTSGPSGGGASRRQLFLCRPTDAAGEEPCARKILSTLASRAYRRPATERDVETLLGFYREGRLGSEAGSEPRSGQSAFEAGIQRGLERILASPSFLFRVEREPAGIAAGAAYRLDDLDLASRLSFFLWSSIPDDELRDAAVRGTLSDPAVLERQIQRMLRDPRSSALVDNFVTRWLELSKLPGVVPDTELYPEFDENLPRGDGAGDAAVRCEPDARQPQRRGTADGRLLVSERTAGKALRDSEYLRQPFPPRRLQDKTRGGLLGQSSLLTVTSYPNRTSVTMRGRWLLANMLGAPPPPPPPDIPGAQGRRRRRAAAFAARADGDAPEEPGVRLVSSADGSRSVFRWRTSTRLASGAPPATARRSIRRRCSPTARGSTASPGCAR